MSGSTIYTWTTAASGDWTTSGDWSVAGFPDGSTAAATISATGANYSISLGGADPLITVASLSITWSQANLDINIAGGAETVLGDVLNQGNINLDNGFNGAGGSTLAIGGTLNNSGNLSMGGSALGAATTLTAAALDNTGVLDVEATNGNPAATANVLLGSAAGFGTAGLLTGQVNLDGFATIAFAGGGQIGTIATGADLQLFGAASVIDAGGTHNSALAGLTANAGELTIEDNTLVLTGNLLNSGETDIDNQFNGAGGSNISVAGTLTNTGRLLMGGGALGAATTLTAAAIDNTGVLALSATNGVAADAETILVAAAAGFGTAGVLTGQVDLNGTATIAFAGGGQIGTIATGADLQLFGAASVIDAGGTHNSALAGLTANAGELTIEDNTLVLTGNLLNSGETDIDNQFNGAGGSNISVAGTLTNTGRLLMGGGALGAATTLTAAAIDNTGLLALSATNGVAADAETILVAAAAGFGTAGVLTGQVELNGTATIAFAGGGQIGTIATGADLQLFGAASVIDAGGTHNAALAGLTANAGELTIEDNTLVLTGNLLNSGETDIDNQFNGAGGSAISVAGTLTNTGRLLMGGGALGAATTLTAAAIDNTGLLALSATNGVAADAETILVAAAAGFGTAGVLTGQVELNGTATIAFAGGGQIGTIATGADLQLFGAASVIDAGGTHNAALAGLTANAGELTIEDNTLVLTGNLLNSGETDIDNQFNGAGGSAISVAGTLTNTGRLLMGGGALGAATTLTAAAIDNTGLLALSATNGVAADAETILVAAAAGFGTAGVLTGQVELNGTATIAFAGGGQIGTIATGADLQLFGAASVIDAGGTHNAALAGLTANAGELTIEDNTLVLTGNLLNSGETDIDNQFNGAGGSAISVAGTLTNTGRLLMGGGALGAATTLTAAAIDNTGVLALSATNGVAADAETILVAAAAGFGTAGVLTGQVELNGTATIAFAGGGQIGTIATGADLQLFGVSSIIDAGGTQNSALAGLTTNAGELSIDADSLALTGNLLNGGEIDIDNQFNGAGGSNISVAGTLTNTGRLLMGGTGLAASGTLTAGALVDSSGGVTLTGTSPSLQAVLRVTGAVSNNAVITLNSDAVAHVGDVSGTGSIVVAGNAALEAGSLSQAVDFSGTGGTLTLDAPLAVTGTISGFAIGDTLALTGIDAIGASDSNDVLTVFLADASTLTYALPGDFIGENFSAVPDTGASIITLALGPPPPPPTIVAPGALTATALTATPVGTITIGETDPDAILRAVVSAGTGTLTASASGTGQVIGNATGAITLTGSLAVLSVELASLDYIGATLGTDPDAPPAADTITETITDNRGQTMAASTTVTVDQVAFTPAVLNTPAGFSYIPGVITSIPGLSVSDPFALTTGATLTLATTVTNGALLFASGPGGATITGNGTGTLDITGSVQQINAILADAEGVDGSGGGSGSGGSGGGSGSGGSGGGSGSGSGSGSGGGGSTGFNWGFFGDPGGIVGGLNGVAGASGGATGSTSGNSGSGSGGSGNSGGSTGHANLTTFDGGYYSFNPEGEFTLARSTVAGDSFDIQTRYAPWDNSSSGSTTIGVAAMVGSDRVTFQVGRATLLMVNGQVSALDTVGSVLNLPGGGGTITELSANSFKVIWATGEQMVVNQNFESTGPYLDAIVSLAPGAAAGSVAGLLGTNAGTADDFTLPDGSVLQQPLSQTQLYADFGAAWAVPAGSQGLFDYPTGENTDNFTDPNFPFDVVTLDSFPAAQVQQAESLATAAGLTNAVQIQSAALNFLVTGDPSFITSAANASSLGLNPTADGVTPPVVTAPLVGLTAEAGALVAGTIATTASFEVYLTSAATSDVTVAWNVISPTAAELGASAFGGALPGGTTTIAAGQTTGTITVDLPAGVLGTAATAVLDLQLSDATGPSGVGIVSPTAQTQLVNDAQEPGTAPIVAIGLGSSNGPTLTQTDAGLVLEIGTLHQGSSFATAFSVANDAAAPADALSGAIIVSGDGFSVSEASLPLIDAGAISDALSVIADTSVLGTHTATLTIALQALNLTGYAGALTPQTILVEDTVGPPCYCPGSMILTPHGEVPVEALAIGDAVRTAAGAVREIVWIGRRSYDQRFLNRSDEVWPVLFRAGALSDGVPHSDLLVSPQHAMFIDGVLVPAALLINGASIRRADPTDRVDYIHVELAVHDILLANGAAAESFVDDGSRGLFHNAAEHAAQYPDTTARPATFCAPRIKEGAQLAAIHRRLAARAGVLAAGPRAAGSPAPLRGHLDEASRERVRGWAMDPDDPDAAVTLEIRDNGRLLGVAVANGDRLDLRRAGIGHGRYGFDIALPGGLSPLERHVLSVRREADGMELAGGPVVIEAADRFDATVEQAVGRALAALDSDAGRSRALAFMLDEVERLRQRQADATAGRAGRRRQAASPRPRALVIDAGLPDPATVDGRRRRTGMTALAALGYAVSIAVPDMASASAAAWAQDDITVCGAPVYAGIEDVLRRQAGSLDVVYLHGIAIATRYLALARGYQPRARILFDTGAMLHGRLAAQAALEDRPALLAASRQAQVQEWLAAGAADAVLVPDAAELGALRAAVPGARAVHLPWTVTRRATAPFTSRRGVAFVGNLAHAADRDAAAWLLEAVMPLVHRLDPSIACLGVTPADRTDFAGARVTIAPLRHGAGMTGEILESLGAGIPCVMTPAAAVGAGAATALRGLVGDDAATLAGHVCRLHADAAANRRAAAAGRRLIRDTAGADVLVDVLRAAIARSAATAHRAA